MRLPARPARSTIPLGRSQLGVEVVLAFEGGNTDRPVIMGLLVEPGPVPQRLQAVVDGEIVVAKSRNTPPAVRKPQVV